MRVLPKLEVFVKKNGATILSGLGSVGVIGTAVLTSKATIKANTILEAVQKDKGEELNLSEKVKYAMPSYIPAVITGAATITCILSANIMNKKYQASLMSAYIMLDQSYKEYRNKVLQLYGDEVDKAIEKEHISGPDDLQLFYDKRSERFFESSLFDVQKAEYFINRELTMRDYVYLNEWYEELGLDIVDDGYKLGWSVGMCLACYWQNWIDFSHSHKSTDDGRDYIEISFWEEPMEDFDTYC